MANTSTWNANSLRFTAFPEANFQIDTNWWENVVGESPETEISQAKTGTLQYEGNFEGGKLVLGIQKNPALPRIDWVYAPSDFDETLPSLGDFGRAVNIFEQYISKWLISSNLSFKRIAFGLTLHQPISDKKQGYELLASRYLGISPHFGENTSDFLYQINRIRQSQQVEGLPINRLMKWSVGRYQPMITIISPTQTTQQSLPESFMVLLELDINSSPEYMSSFKDLEASNLLKEFVSLAYEIAEKGEID
jgi:hypothetical protein